MLEHYVSLDTTNRYAEINLRAWRKPFRSVSRQSVFRLDTTNNSVWRDAAG
jgi:hypothetical protein